jgi:hypothetical protein
MQMAGIKPPDISGRKDVAAAKMQVANAMAKEYANTGVLPTQMKVNQDEHAALSKALTQVTSRVAGIELGSRKIEKDIKTINDYIKPGALDYAKIVNKIGNSLRSASSDPTLAPYALAVKQVAIDYERLMVGGMLSVAQLHEGAREDAKAILSENMTIAEVNAVIPVMLREIENQKQASKETLADLKEQISTVGQARNAPAATAAQPYQDAEKEKRYQEWKAKHGSQ